MVRFEEVAFRYSEGEEDGIRGLNLNIEQGECVLLTGASGCGKTTVTRLVNGLAPHFYEGSLKGRVLVNGMDTQAVTPDVLSTVVGSVFQNPRSQFFNLDTTSEIAFGCENLGLEREEIHRRIQDTAKLLGIERLLDRDIFGLSGGEKQLVALASVHALSPNIFVLDEPTSNLDVQSIALLRNILFRIKQAGKTILIAEHRLYFLQGIADRIILMQNGNIGEEWNANTFFGQSDEWRRNKGLRAIGLNKLEPTKKQQLSGSGNENFTLHKVSARYKKNNPVLNEVSFLGNQGEVISIIGHNGQGKSTLARVICGLKKEKSGKVQIQRKKQKPSARTQLTYLVMQEMGAQLFSDSVAGEITFGLKKKQTAIDAPRVRHLLRHLNLEAFADKHPMNLSGGQQQRLSIAVGLHRDVPIIIMDEPTSGLDYGNMQRVTKLIEELKNAGKTIVLITHDYEFLLEVSDQIVELSEGRISREYALNKGTLSLLQEFYFIIEEKNYHE